MEKGDLRKEEEAALLCKNSGEDEEPEKEIPRAQVNQKHAKKTNKQPIETRKAKQPVRQVILQGHPTTVFSQILKNTILLAIWSAFRAL